MIIEITFVGCDNKEENCIIDTTKLPDHYNNIIKRALKNETVHRGYSTYDHNGEHVRTCSDSFDEQDFTTLLKDEILWDFLEECQDNDYLATKPYKIEKYIELYENSGCRHSGRVVCCNCGTWNYKKKRFENEKYK